MRCDFTCFVFLFPAMAKTESNRMTLKAEGPYNPSAPAAASAYAMAGNDNSFDIAEFKKSVAITVQSLNESEFTFDLNGVDPSIANALRRIMIGEVETVAIDKVHLWQNTGVIHDEVLCHRLGLIPIWVPEIAEVAAAPEEAGNVEWDQSRAIKFKLHVKCPADYPKGQSLAVKSSDLIFQPQSRAEAAWVEKPRPVSMEILIAKLRPGQEIEAELYCLRGSSKIHTKWSPVCSASYRLLPSVRFSRPVQGSEARDLVKLCPKKVFDLEDAGNAFVADERACSTCRLCIEKFPDAVDLGKIRDSFLFTVESTGCMPPAEIAAEAISILKTKALRAKENLSTLL